jgi:hypothetical protein
MRPAAFEIAVSSFASRYMKFPGATERESVDVPWLKVTVVAEEEIAL